MTSKPLPQELIRLGTFRTRDAEALGVSRQALANHLARGEVERDARGIYQIAGAEPNPYFQYGVLAARGVPFVVSLLSALHLHGLTTQLPSSLWITVKQGRHCPVGAGLHTVCTYQSEPAYSTAVSEMDLGGIRVKVYSPAKTVVDCFKFRRKVGLDVAMEALRDGWLKRAFAIPELDRIADICRMRTVMRPYVEALLS